MHPNVEIFLKAARKRLLDDIKAVRAAHAEYQAAFAEDN
jgi:hypothetical protein